MSDETSAEVTPIAPTGDISTQDAAEAIAKRRQPAAPLETPEPVSASSPEVDAAPQGPGDEQEVDPVTPSIEPPRSWTSEAKEAFSHLPQDQQRWLADQAEKQEKDFLRRQNEVTEQSKALQAHVLQTQQARQQYEYALTQTLQALVSSHQGEFADIKTQADVDRLANEDVLRYIRWDASQKKIASKRLEHQQAQQRAYQEQVDTFHKFVASENAKLEAKFSELRDPVKAAELQAKVVNHLTKDRGFSQADLQYMVNRGDFRDARVQEIFYDAMRYRDAQAKLDKAKLKPVPQVQRPGVATVRPDAPTARIQDLSKQLTQSGKIEDAAKLIAARRARARATA